MPAALVATDPAFVGRYRIRARLGSGGMGAVYLGVDPTGRLAAVKVIRADMVTDAEFRERFRRETAAAARVRGAFVAQFLDADLEAESPWLATEYVDGVSLAGAVGAHGRLGDAMVHAVGSGLATGLLEVHAAGLVHRDLKPSNILFGGSGPKIIDFGIARALDGTAHTGTGTVLGTVAWMAPEQLLGERAGPATDMFAWAMCVAFAARGRHPFPAEAPAATAMRMLRDIPDLTGVPDRLVPLLAQALDKDPLRRPGADEALSVLLGVGVTSLEQAEDVTRHAMGQLWRPPAPSQPVVPPLFTPAGDLASTAGSGPGPFGAAGHPVAPTRVEPGGAPLYAHPGGPPPRRRGRRVWAAVAGVAVVGVLAAVVAVRALGDPTPDRAALASPATTAVPSTAPAPATASASPAPTETASPTPSPAPAAAPTTAAVPTPAAVPLIRYYNGWDHTATTGAAPDGYWVENVLGSVYPSGDVPGTYPLYSCLIGTDSFTSPSADCEGQQVVGVLGWVYASPPAQPATRPVLRCQTGDGEHFLSPDAACEGQAVEGVQGYVVAG